jgi:hypothetical protein
VLAVEHTCEKQYALSLLLPVLQHLPLVDPGEVSFKFLTGHLSFLSVRPCCSVKSGRLELKDF